LLEMELKPDTFANVMKSGVTFEQKVKLIPGKYQLSLGVRDIRTNLMGSVSVAVEIAGRF
jgi:hypothetical protein